MQGNESQIEERPSKMRTSNESTAITDVDSYPRAATGRWAYHLPVSHQPLDRLIVEVAALETSNLILDECGHRGNFRFVGGRGLRASAGARHLFANASVALVRSWRGFLPLHFRRGRQIEQLLLTRHSDAWREQVRAYADDGSAAGRTLTLHRFAQLGDSPGVHVATATAPDFVSDLIGLAGGLSGRGRDYRGGQGTAPHGALQGSIIFEEPADRQSTDLGRSGTESGKWVAPPFRLPRSPRSRFAYKLTVATQVPLVFHLAKSRRFSPGLRRRIRLGGTAGRLAGLPQDA